MRKFFITLLSIICLSSLIAFGACNKEENVTTEHTHNYIATDSVDSDGNTVYTCECGDVHEHTFASVYTYDEIYHYYASTCGHSDAKKNYGTHDIEDGEDTCSICNYDATAGYTYSIIFAYCQYDSDGNPVVDEDTEGEIEVGVTYTAVETSFGLVDIENGDTVMKGDVISFTCVKSVYCYYTDSNEYPVVYANTEVVSRSSDGVYTLTISSDMASSSGEIIIWVGNVLTRESTIGGSGTEDDPYTINNVTDWLYFSNFINNKSWYADLSYNVAYYVLTCDLDFEGEEVYIVGNGYDSDYAMFMGNFDGNGYSLTNFVLSNEVTGYVDEYSQYVGVFGVCSAYSGVSAVISNLTLSNFTINATAPYDDDGASAVIVGSLVGYAAGYNIINCQAIDGEMNITGSDSESYSYGGGLVGILQSYLDSDNGYAYYASIQYSSVTNFELIGSGTVHSAGGIVGYVMAYAESAPIYIINNYSYNLVVSGAIHAGGIAGMITRYTSVQNCYAVGSISAYSNVINYLSSFEGTSLDDRYAYAGGIVGFAENDTIIASCFFVGELNGSSDSGSKYVSTGYLYGGASAQGFEEYYAEYVSLFNNLHDNSTSITLSSVTESALKGIGWSTADWVLTGSYPTINTESESLTYTIIISISGDGVSTYTESIVIDSSVTSYVYLPMSYRYLLAESGESTGIQMYIRSEDNSDYRTFGYYFDEACTQKVPTCYIITGNITLYSKFIDCSSLVDKTYYIVRDNVEARIVLYASGYYTYEEGAIYYEGTYEYDGTTIVFKNALFSRLALDSEYDTQVTDDQRATYYTFYAYIDSNGDLHIYDGVETFILESDYSSYDYLVRFYAIYENELLAVSEDNVSFAGTYYDTNGNIYVIYKDYTGLYNGTTQVTYTIESGVITLYRGAQEFTVALDEDGKIYSLTYTNGVVTYLTAYDDFTGTWTISGVVSKTFTFDGKGQVTYSYNGTTNTYTYTINEDDVAVVEIDGVTYYIAIVNNSLVIESSEGSESVNYYQANSYAGTWLTYQYKVTRYSLVLYGINSLGYGEAEYYDTEGFRYYASDANTLYLYYGDVLYAKLEVKSGVLVMYIYDEDEDSYTEGDTFYMYDSFYGTWAGSISELGTLKFNGMGLYNVASNDDERAVVGTVTINGSTTVNYSVNMSSGIATFTYNGVTYTLTYDEYTNTITATYNGGVATFGEFDSYLNVVFYDDDNNTITFDGRSEVGNGTITLTIGGNTYTATYVVSENDIIISGNLSGSITIKDGAYYIEITSLDYSATLKIQNSFAGTWAVNTQYTLLVIDEITSVESDENGNIQVSGTYGDEAITLYYDGEMMYFVLDNTTYYVIDVEIGLVLATDSDWTYADTYYFVTEKGVTYGTYEIDGVTYTFDGTANTDLVTKGSVQVTINGETTEGVYIVTNESDDSVTVMLSVNGSTSTITINLNQESDEQTQVEVESE